MTDEPDLRGDGVVPPEGAIPWARAESIGAVLDIERLDRDLFRGVNAASAFGQPQLYGGQVAAQALRAAGLTVDDDRHPHSMHGYFLRTGQVDRPVLLQVDRDRDGRSFSARHVTAVQDGEVIFSMLASFHVDETSGTHQPEVRAVPLPEDLPPEPTAHLIERHNLTPTGLIDGRFRFVDRLWAKSAEPLPDDRLIQACALTYLSDLGSGFGQIDIDRLAPGGSSIDHAIWFHAPIRADDWVLIDLHPVKAHGARGVYTGTLHDRDGTLGALIAQELLLRPWPADLDLDGMGETNR